jgi:site-specific DNA-methyltransferase (cytosine-N4-specific)
MIEMWDEMFAHFGCNTYEQMHEFLAETWKRCYDALVDGGIMCINIGDATRKNSGDGFRLYPNHARIIEHCEKIGFATLPYILWKKPTNKPNAFLGSGFLPPNAYVTLDCEYILIFRKGNIRKFEPKNKARYESIYTKEERDVWFSQIWNINGIKQSHEELVRRTAEFPEGLVSRLVKMFSVKGDTVLDPFLGTGTTTKVAKELGRNSIGYEIENEFLPIIKKKVGQRTLDSNFDVTFETI